MALFDPFAAPAPGLGVEPLEAPLDPLAAPMLAEEAPWPPPHWQQESLLGQSLGQGWAPEPPATEGPPDPFAAFPERTGAFAGEREPVFEGSTLAAPAEGIGTQAPYAPGVGQAVGVDAGPAPSLEPVGEVPEMTPQERAAALEAQGPEAVAEDAAMRDQERADYMADRTLAVLGADAKKAADAHATYQERFAAAQQESEALRKEAKRLAEENVRDPWESKSTGQKIRNIAMGFLGGLVQRDGPNQGLQMIRDEMDRDIERQKANLHQRGQALGQQQGLVADLYAQIGDEYQAAETARQAGLHSLDQMLAAEQQKFDPAGSAAQRILAARQQVQAQIQKGQMEAERYALDKHVKLGELEVKERDQALKERQFAAKGRGGPKVPQQTVDMYEKGLIKDPRTGLMIPDPRPRPEGGNPEQRKKEADATKAELEAEQLQRGGRVVARGAGGEKIEIGRSLYGTTGAKEAADMTTAYRKFRETEHRLISLVHKDQTLAKANGWVGWPSETRTEIDRLRNDLANQLAKLRDPTSVNREGEVEIAKKEIPDADGWWGSQNPIVGHKTLVKTADDVYRVYLEDNVEDFDIRRSPIPSYQAQDRRLFGERGEGPPPGLPRRSGGGDLPPAGGL